MYYRNDPSEYSLTVCQNGLAYFSSGLLLCTHEHIVGFTCIIYYAHVQCAYSRLTRLLSCSGHWAGSGW